MNAGTNRGGETMALLHAQAVANGDSTTHVATAPHLTMSGSRLVVQQGITTYVFTLSQGTLTHIQTRTDSAPLTQVIAGNRSLSLDSNLLQDMVDSAQTTPELTRSMWLYSEQSSFAGDAASVLATVVSDQVYFIITRAQTDQIYTLRQESNGSLTHIHSVSDTNNSYANSVTHMASATFGGNTYVFTASQSESGISSYRLKDNGKLSLIDSLGAQETVGLNTPTALHSVTLDGETLLLVGAAGSSSISVMAVAQDGSLSLRDHLSDTLTTRFGTLSVMETITYNDQLWIVAGGGDDGLTLLTLLPGGTLHVIDSIADSTMLGLNNVNGLALTIDQDQLHIFATSQIEAGVSHIRTEPLDGLLQIGGDSNDRLTAADTGGHLLDGGGTDVLVGGAGADVFVFSADGAREDIIGFDPSMDRLDLSAWSGLTSVSQLDITAQSNGAVLRYNTEEIRLYTSDNSTLSRDDFFLTDMLSGLIRPSTVIFEPVAVVETGVLLGQAGDDVLHGTSVHNEIWGRDGDDSLFGEGGNDTLYGEDGNDSLSGDDGADQLTGGYGNDTLTGGDDGDWLKGDDGNDSLKGGSQKDSLEGGNGNDILRGNDGDDTLKGNDGDDTLEGGQGTDSLKGGDGSDHLWGNSGHDTLKGGSGKDWLTGGRKHDQVSGGDGDDTLFGGSGKDTLEGGQGTDLLEGGSGKDRLWGNSGHDTLDGGSGKDQLYGGRKNDHLSGGSGDDTLNGGSGKDTLSGDSGDDTLEGGSATDTFVFTRKDDNDEIMDFTLGQDRLALDGDLVNTNDAAQVLETYGTQNEAGLMLDFGKGDTLFLHDIAPNDLNALADDIIFL